MREVLLKIKSASLRCEDLEIPCELSVTVKELKKLIQFHYPLHPDIGDQRLIYAGHLLEDSQTLAQVLLPNSEASQSSFTLHLACTSSFFQPSRQKFSRTQENCDVPLSKPPSTVQPTSFDRRAPGVPTELLGLHQHYVQQMMTYMTEWSQGKYNSVNWSSTHNQLPNLTGHIHNINCDSPDSGLNANGDTQNTPSVEVIAEAARVAEIARVEDAARVAAEAARLANIARVAAARDEDEAPRDVIDWMYTLSRVALIFSVVYFYSNFTRFFLVVVLSALVFILQRRPFLWNGRQPVQEVPNVAGIRRPVNNQPVGEGEVQPEVPADAVDTNGAEVNTDGESPNSQEAEAATNSDGNPVELIPEAQQAARINPRDVTWTFLTTFFTSLIPEIPQN